MSGKVISIINFKGGVGKTTLSVNLAASLAHEYHHSTLLIDLDPQSNASIWMLGEPQWHIINKPENTKHTCWGLFNKKFSLDHILCPYTNPETTGYLPDLYLIPASFRLVALESTIVKREGALRVMGNYDYGGECLYLGRHIHRLTDRHDFTVIDCPPNLYYVTQNALCHSDYILIPCIPDTLSTIGLRLLVKQLHAIIVPLLKHKAIKKAPIILGVALTRFRSKLNEHQNGIQTIQTILEDFRENKNNLLVNGRTRLFESTPLREYVAHAEAVQYYRPLCLHQPTSKAYHDIKGLTQAVREGMGG